MGVAKEVEAIKRLAVIKATAPRPTGGVELMKLQDQKLRVCDVCGAFLSIYDSDRRLAWELVLGVSRQWGTLRAYVDELLRDDFEKLPADVQRALVLGAYQLLFLDRIPPHAAVNESVELAKRESQW